MNALQQRLDQRLSVSLNAQLQQTLRVLNLGAVELTQLIHDQCERNPFLEIEYSPPEEEFFSYSSSSARHQSSNDLDALSWLHNIPDTTSVREHLVRQIDASFSRPDLLKIAFFLLDALDESGYIRVDLSVVSFIFQVPLDTVEGVLQKLQSFEPSGVFARHLQEALMLQLKEKGQWDPVAENIVRALCAQDPHQALKQSLKHSVCPDLWKEKCCVIQKLPPKPLESYQAYEDISIIPDLYLHEHQGIWAVHVNARLVPYVFVHQESYRALSSQPMTAHERDSIRGYWSHAQSFVQALKQRHSMMTRVGTLLFQTQEDFLTQGKRGLKPLTLQEVADSLSMNVSTISRAIRGKFVQTPHGTYPLKFFFKNGPCRTQSHITAPYIQEKIQKLIRQEPPHKPLSDQEIAAALSQSCMVLSRRTVQKYREQMRIPNASLRRRLWVT